VIFVCGSDRSVRLAHIDAAADGSICNVNELKVAQAAALNANPATLDRLNPLRLAHRRRCIIAAQGSF
jgi:hypothetical protein